MPKIAVVTNIATPYRKKQFSLICQNFEGTIDIYFTDSVAADRKWKIAPESNYYFLPKVLGFGRFGSLNLGLVAIARNYDCIVIGGYEQPTYLMLALFCGLLNVPYMVVFDGIAPGRVRSRGSWITRLIKCLVLRNATACFANGLISQRYISETLGITSLPLYNQFLSVDESPILRALPQRPELRRDFLQRHELPPTAKLILYSGRLIDRKRVGDLIRALTYVPNSILIVAGHGYKEEQLRTECMELNQQAIFLGHLDTDDLARTYVLADCLVLPSIDEPWGLVVNEALLANIPVVVSDDCGCAIDLVISEKNGFIFSTGQILDLAMRIKQALELDATTVTLTAQGIMHKWNLESSAKSFLTMLQTHLVNA